MRIFCFYIVIILIALQLVNTISAKRDNHDYAHQNDVQTSHNGHASSHHSNTLLVVLPGKIFTGEVDHGDTEHPDCHANHCHHSHQSNLVYVDLSAQVHLAKMTDKQVNNKNALFNSLLISPASCPPIV